MARSILVCMPRCFCSEICTDLFSFAWNNTTLPCRLGNTTLIHPIFTNFAVFRGRPPIQTTSHTSMQDQEIYIWLWWRRNLDGKDWT